MLIRHPDSVRGNDLYETPEPATLALLAVEPLPPTILEPACGRGAISNVLRRAGHAVLENDIVDYGLGQDSVQDFLNFKPAPPPRSVPSSRIHLTGWRSSSSDTP
jgi:hypothetical protein